MLLCWGITLTKRHEMPMAGIPFHAAEGYLTKLLNAGHKVAICDQLETAQTGKLVKRGITRILTPGTVLEDRQLEASVIILSSPWISIRISPLLLGSIYLPENLSL